MDKKGREIFCLQAKSAYGVAAVQAKLRATSIEPSLTYFRDRLRIPWAHQVVLEGKRDFVQHGIRCLPAPQFLGAPI